MPFPTSVPSLAAILASHPCPVLGDSIIEFLSLSSSISLASHAAHGVYAWHIYMPLFP